MVIIEKMMEGWSKGVYETARELMVKRERESGLEQAKRECLARKRWMATYFGRSDVS